VVRTPIRAIFFLGGLVFLSRNAGEMTHQLERTFGLLCFVLFCLSHIERRSQKRNAGALLLGLLLFGAGLAVLGIGAPVPAAALALATVGLWFLVSGFGIATLDMAAYVLTALGFFVLLLLGETLSEAWYVGRWFAHLACAMSNLLAGTTIDFRPIYAGLPITGLLLLFWGAKWICGTKRRWSDLAVPVGLTLVAQILYLVFAAWILDSLLPGVRAVAGRPLEQLHWHQAFLTRSLPWNLPFVLFLMNIPIIFWGAGHRDEASESQTPPNKEWFRAPIAIPLFIVSLGLLCYLPIRGFQTRPGPIVFYEKGFLNWEVPKWGDYGPLSVGMFGNLPRFVGSLGLTSHRTAEITSASLLGASALVIINLNHPLPTTSTAAIWKFVERGGTLLVLGDHTAYDPSDRVFVNELLAPASIAFHLDSAICPVGGWLHCYDFQWHPLTVGLGDERNEAGIVTGASLDVRWPAYPIVLGRYGFEDAGNRYRPDMAYLGNMSFDPDEPLGDTVLAAAQRYGRGKVLVFGDTSSFANGIVVGTHDFVGRVFRWMAAPGGHGSGSVRAAAAFILLAGAAFLLLWKNPPGQWSLLFLSLFAVVIPAAAQRYWVGLCRQPLRGQIAYLDQSHLPIASEEGWRDDGLMGLQMNLMRSGFLAFNLYDFDAEIIASARLLVIVAPARRFTTAEINTARHYVEAGGTAIVSVGCEESSASQPLLDAFDIEIENRPLGYFRVKSPVLGLEAMFYEGWSVLDRSGEAEVISGHGEWPLIVVKPCGKGRLVVIGDSHFLLNKNLEAEKSYNETNIIFLKALLEYLAGQAGNLSDGLAKSGK